VKAIVTSNISKSFSSVLRSNHALRHLGRLWSEISMDCSSKPMI
jgi:hypothetical protein